MGSEKTTIGSAIDQVVEALRPFEKADQDTIIAAAQAHLGTATIKYSTPATSPEVIPRDASSDLVVGATVPIKTWHSPIPDIRSFKESKQPKSAKQMACIVAYYLQEVVPPSEKKEIITREDIERLFKEAKFKLPGKLEQLLIDAKSSGYFKSVGRGQYTLTRVGYNLVAHQLPPKS